MAGHDQLIAPVRITDKDGNSAAVVYDPVSGLYRLAVDSTGGGGGVSNVTLIGNTQVQTQDLILSLFPFPGTYTSGPHDCNAYADFAVSVYLSRIALDTSVDFVLQTSYDGISNWREVDRQTLEVTAAKTEANLNRNYSCTRRWMRVLLINNGANVNAEVVTVQKPIG